MSPQHAHNEIQKLQFQLHFHRGMNIGLVVILLIGILLLGWVTFRETTHLVPPEIRRPYEIGANSVNKEYLLDMAEYVLSAILTTSPDSVEHNNQVILKMTAPEGYPALKTALEAAALRIKQENLTTIWTPKNEVVFEQDKRVKVHGVVKTFIADKLTSQRDKTYLVDFMITHSGRLYVANIEEVLDDKAHLNTP